LNGPGFYLQAISPAADFGAALGITVTKQDQLAFIAKVLPGALQSQKEHGMPASVTIAQAIDESGYGESGLAKECNNFFGIKAGKNQDYKRYMTDEYYTVKPGDTIEKIARAFETTAEVLKKANPQGLPSPLVAGAKLKLRLPAKFRKFASFDECVRAHCDLIALNERYAPAIAETSEPLVFAMRLKECGYSTDDGYVQKLGRLIKQFSLNQYDVKAAKEAVAQ
jgi:flagellum-specific peptidoglycan hydrolase FlgJ